VACKYYIAEKRIAAMGRYKDSDTLDFLNWLKLKGESLGFAVELDCYLGKEDYCIDVAWKFGKNQAPLVTFEVETINCGKIFFKHIQNLRS
jgi:hypothetical protein